MDVDGCRCLVTMLQSNSGHVVICPFCMPLGSVECIGEKSAAWWNIDKSFLSLSFLSIIEIEGEMLVALIKFDIS